MVIQIQENVLISIFGIMLGVIFVPLFLFFLRMYVRVNKLEDKLNAVITSREKVEVHIDRLGEHDSLIRLLSLRLDNLEKYKNGK